MPSIALQTVSKPAVLEMGTAGLREWLQTLGCPGWHADQIERWIIVDRALDFDVMSNLPRDLRERAAREIAIFSSHIAAHQEASDGTHKLLIQLGDGERVECVLIQDGARKTACISTQVGCGMGCVFCASGLNGVQRNLTVAEILEQLIRLRNLLRPIERLTNIVVMGMGEPLANLENLLEALATVGSPRGLNIGARHITISTVGLPGRIRQLADSGKQYHLAISLHAPNDVLRSRIVPTNDKTGLDDILAASDYFFQRTGRQVTFEYVLLRDLNDGKIEARELAGLLAGRKSHVNVIPFNDVAGLPYQRPGDAALHRFVDILRASGISVKVRKRKGAEIDAACGQLRRKEQIS